MLKKLVPIAIVMAILSAASAQAAAWDYVWLKTNSFDEVFILNNGHYPIMATVKITTHHSWYADEVEFRRVWVYAGCYEFLGYTGPHAGDVYDVSYQIISVAY